MKEDAGTIAVEDSGKINNVSGPSERMPLFEVVITSGVFGFVAWFLLLKPVSDWLLTLFD